MTFKLFGGVELRSEQYGALIKSDELEWVEEDQIYIARGNVRVSTEAWSLGPSSTIYADKELTQMTNNKEDLDL